MSYILYPTGISIAYSGIPQTPIILSFVPPYVTLIPNIYTISGYPMTLPTIGPRINSFNYTELNTPSGNALISLTFNDLNHVIGSFSPKSLSKLVDLSAPNLTAVCTDFTPTELDNLTGFSFPTLQAVGANFRPTSTNLLKFLNLPSLAVVGGNFECNIMSSLTGISMPSLVTIYKNFIPNNINLVKDLSFPLLKNIGGDCSPSVMTGITGISLSGMRRYESGINIPTTMSGLITASFGTSGTLQAIMGPIINLSGLNLNVESVTGLLWLLTSLNGLRETISWGAGKTLILTGGNNAAVVGQGITDKTTLVGRGATISNN